MKELGLGQLQERFNSQGWRTCGNFAVGAPEADPGVDDDELFRNCVINVLVGCAADAPVPPEDAAM